MTSKPHDALFKAAFEQPEHAAGLVRGVLPPALGRAIRWSTMTRETGSFIDPELADRHSDLLFSVELGDEAERGYVYRGLPPIIPVVVSHAPNGWAAPVHFEDMMRPHPSEIEALAAFVPTFSLAVEDFSHATDDELKARALAAFPKLALWVMRDARDVDRLLANLASWAETLRLVLRTPSGSQALDQVLRYIALVASGDVQWDVFRAKIREQIPEAEDGMATMAEQLVAQGRAEAQAEAQLKVVQKLLVLKFGSLSNEHQRRLDSATPTQLDLYVERVLTAETIEDVLA